MQKRPDCTPLLRTASCRHLVVFVVTLEIGVIQALPTNTLPDRKEIGRIVFLLDGFEPVNIIAPEGLLVIWPKENI